MPNATDHGRVVQPSTAIITGAEMTRVGQMAYNDRARILGYLFNGTAGVFTGLNASATGADMVVTVAAGEGIDGDGYPINVPAAVPAGGTTPSVTIAAADPADPRIDVVYLQAAELDADQNNIATKAAAGSPVVYQDLHQTKLNYFTIHVAAGVPAGSPVAPAIPAGALEVCEVAVAAAAATIGPGDITDKRHILPNMSSPDISVGSPTMAYDDFGNLTGATDGANTITITGAGGLVTAMTSTNGANVTLTRDSIGRLTGYSG